MYLDFLTGEPKPVSWSYLSYSWVFQSENSTKQSVKVNLTKQIFWFVPLSLFNCFSFCLFLVLLRAKPCPIGNACAVGVDAPEGKHWPLHHKPLADRKGNIACCGEVRHEGKSSCRNFRSVRIYHEWKLTLYWGCKKTSHIKKHLKICFVPVDLLYLVQHFYTGSCCCLRWGFCLHVGTSFVSIKININLSQIRDKMRF